MRCDRCRKPSGDLATVLRHKRCGFGFRTTRLRLCPDCPPPVSADGAVVVGREPIEARS